MTAILREHTAPYGLAGHKACQDWSSLLIPCPYQRAGHATPQDRKHAQSLERDQG